jgi:hypothetical protein
LEHFKKLHGNSEFYQNECHPRNTQDTKRLCAKATDVLDGKTLQPAVSFLGGDALQEVVEWNLRPGVGGGRA